MIKFDACFAEEKQDAVELDKDENKGPQGAARNNRKVQRKHDRGQKRDRSVQVLVDKQILDVKLPAKIVETCSVKPYSSELAIYSQYEKTLLKALHGKEREILFFSLNIIIYVVC